ncbi:RDD family protein [Streptosporangium sp. NPDC051022]|uniref:RDD family protein n=1 Tax=Streptosporangium sp. NPDC051022 TaxID=3155752 RepID=UPI0034175CF3
MGSPPPDNSGSNPWSGQSPYQGYGAEPPGQGPGTGPPPGWGYGTEPPIRLGGRWRRLFAGVLDLVIVGIISSPFSYDTVNTVWETTKNVLVRVPVQNTLLAGLIGFLYYWLLTAFWNGQTLGKKLFGLRVVDVSGRRVGVGQAAIRELVAWVLYATCCLGWINLAFILFTRRKQAIHDMAARTLVVDS